MSQSRNPNPVVLTGPCVDCGREVALFERDAEDYLAGPSGGLRHFDCQAAAPDVDAERGYLDRRGRLAS